LWTFVRLANSRFAGRRLDGPFGKC
jgi:hypothetical protein